MKSHEEVKAEFTREWIRKAENDYLFSHGIIFRPLQYLFRHRVRNNNLVKLLRQDFQEIRLGQRNQGRSIAYDGPHDSTSRAASKISSAVS